MYKYYVLFVSTDRSIFYRKYIYWKSRNLPKTDVRNYITDWSNFWGTQYVRMLHLSLDGEGGGALSDSPFLPQVLYLQYKYMYYCFETG